MTNKEIVTEFFVQGYVNHDYERMMAVMAHDYYDNSPCAARSSQECAEVLRNTEKAFPDMQIELHDLIEEDGKVTVRIAFTGTYQGGMYDIPVKNKKVTFEALEVFRLKNGLIVESWGYWPDAQIEKMLEED